MQWLIEVENLKLFSSRIIGKTLVEIYERCKFAWKDAAGLYRVQKGILQDLCNTLYSMLNMYTNESFIIHIKVHS